MPGARARSPATAGGLLAPAEAGQGPRSGGEARTLDAPVSDALREAGALGWAGTPNP